jgi:Holliday junction resolvase RusA-like endonuclease
MTLTFFVAGTPRPQPRPRFVNGRAVSTLDAKSNAWKAALRACAGHVLQRAGKTSESLGLREAISMELTFTFATGEEGRFGKPHTHKPDADNLAKLVMDALVDGGLWVGDDSRVADLTVRKRWCAAGEEGVSVSVYVDAQVQEQAAPDWLG